MSKLGDLAKWLSKKAAGVRDPFDDNYFDRREYEERRQKEEPEVIDQAMRKAKKKQDYELEKRKATVFTTDITHAERYWE